MDTRHILVAAVFLIIGMLLQKWFDPLGKIGM